MKNPHINRRQRWKRRVICLGILLLSGCVSTSPPARIYQLVALSEAVAPDAGGKSQTLRLQSVTLPGALHQPTVVTQASPVVIQRSEFDRWAEPLEGHLSDVLTRNLAALLPEFHVVRGRMHPDLKADVSVHVEVLQFGGVLGESAHLEVRWSQSREGAAPVLHRWQGQRTLENDDVQVYVLAQSELLAEASQALAQHLSGGGPSVPR